MTTFEKRLDAFIEIMSDPYISVKPSGIKKIKENIISAAKESLWHPADGDYLPEIDCEVIALLKNGKVCFAHRPQDKYIGTSVTTGEVSEHTPKKYGKGGWNIPDVKWWLDVATPD